MSYQEGESQVVSDAGVYREGLTECRQQKGVGAKPGVELVVRIYGSLVVVDGTVIITHQGDCLRAEVWAGVHYERYEK